MSMNPNERLKLQEMIKANDVVDQTERIRQLKHSSPIYADVTAYLQLTKKYPGSQHKEFFKQMCLSKCSFLYNHYTDIYNKMTKNELDLNILLEFVNVLADIERGDLDQHEASYKVGKVLKEMYIDTAMKREEKMKRKESREKGGKKVDAPSTGKKISYQAYKAKMLNGNN
jgi:hypothetical protein